MLWSSRKNPPATLALLLCLAALPALYACGYIPASDMPTVLGGNEATLKLTGVEQPTLYPWVVHTVRSALRDEINARNLAVWVDNERADYNMHVKVHSFTMRGAVSSSTDETLLYTGSVSLTVTIYRSDDNTEIWRNTVSYSNRFENETEEDAGRSLFSQAVRRLTNSMRNTF